MDEDKKISNDGEHSQPLEELAEDNRKLMDEMPADHAGRGDRDRYVDMQLLREVMYALHDVSIGTHQLLYFSAMKYCKNYLAVDAEDMDAAVEELADIFDRQNVGLLSLRDKEGGKVVFELAENALTFDADTDKPICYFLSGYIAGLLENALGSHYVVNETDCISQGNDVCVFQAQKR